MEDVKDTGNENVRQEGLSARDQPAKGSGKKPLYLL